MNRHVQYLKETIKSNSDFIVREIETFSKHKVYIAFYESLVDSASIYDYVISNVYSHINIHGKVKEIKPLIGSAKLSELKDDEEMFYYLESGFALILYKNEKYAIEVKANLDRGITMSQTEPSMYGSKDAFCENYQKNLGVLKRRIKSKKLKVESVDHGEYTKNKMALIYLDDKVNETTLNNLKNIMNNYKEREVIDSYDIFKELEKNNLFPTVYKTEKPGIAARFIMKGYIVVSIDNAPFALVIDAKFKDFINPFTTDKFISILRYLILILTVLTPAFYIALINYNQETIPISLLLNFSEQRSSMPFPAVIEAMIMLFICEVLRESDIRFPSNYGSSASILGALIIGDAAVSAGIVSPIMIIVVAISFISSLIFTEIKLVSAIRFMRFFFLIVAGFLGLYGLAMAIIATIAILSNIKINEGTYL